MINFELFSEKSKILINDSQNKAIENNHQQVTPEHLVLTLFDQNDEYIKNILNDLNVDISKIRKDLEDIIQSFPTILGNNVNIYFSSEMVQAFLKSKDLIKEFNDRYISPEILLYSILNCEKLKIFDLLLKNGLNKDTLKKSILKIRKGQTIDSSNKSIDTDALKKFSVDVTELARNGKLDPVIGREEEIRRSIQVLSRRTKNNPVLIGEPGVGKTAIIEGLALRIVNDDVPDSLKLKKILSLDLGLIIAGAKFRGEFEERLKSILKEVSENQNSIILFIDEIHTLVGAGKADGSLDASNLLKPALARGELHCIGATTLNEYRENIEKDTALARRFQQVLVEEPSIDDSISILRGLKQKYEAYHGVKILDSAIISAVELSNRYINDRFLPDKAIDLMDEAASRIRLQIDSKPEDLDKIERKLLQNKIEYESLKKDDDKKSTERSKDLKKIIGELENQYNNLNQKWNKEKEKIIEIQRLKSDVDLQRNKLNILQRDGKLSEAGELAYGKIPELEKKLSYLEETKENTILSKEVTSNEIAQVVSKITGVPEERMLEKEKNKILNMNKILASKVIGQKEAIEKISKAVLRSRAGIQDPDRPIGIFLFLGPTGVGKTENLRKLFQIFYSTKQIPFLD